MFGIHGGGSFGVCPREQNGPAKAAECRVSQLASNQAMGEMRDGGFFSDIWRGFTIYGACPSRICLIKIILTPTGARRGGKGSRAPNA